MSTMITLATCNLVDKILKKKNNYNPNTNVVFKNHSQSRYLCDARKTLKLDDVSAFTQAQLTQQKHTSCPGCD